MSKGKGKDKDTLIDSHVPLLQCKRAVEALHAYTLKKEQKAAETELLPGKEQYVWLQVAVKQMHPEKKLKPFKIPLVHPLVDPRTSQICLITKDPQREYKDLIESHGIKFISRVVGVSKLKGKFKPYEARRMLLKENGMFLTDERIVPLLPGLLGSKWFAAKKQPIPVCLTRKDLKGELERAISSTYMHQNQGTCTSIKIATTTQSSSQTLANLQTALPAIIANIRGGWNNVQSLHLKTNDSVALPLWTCGLGEEDRWDGLVKDDEAMKEEGGTVSEDEMDVDEVVEDETPKKSKGKKRPPEEDTQEEEKPKKKVKGAQSLSQVTPNSPVQVTKRKRKASLIPDPVLTRKEREDPIPVAAEDDLSKKKKRRKSSVGVADAPKTIDPLSIDTATEVDVDTTEALEPSSKLKKTNGKSKSRTSLDTVAEGISTAIAHPLPISVSEPKPEGTQVNPKKRKKARELVDTPMLLEPIEIVPPQTLTAAEASTIDLPQKTPKHNKKAKAKLADAAPGDSISVLAPTKATSDAPAENDKKRKRKSKAPAGDEPTKDAPASVISVDNTVASTFADAPKEGEKGEKKAKAAGSDSATDAISTSLLDKSVVLSLTGASGAGEKKVKRPKAAGSTPITDVRPSSPTDISEAPTLTIAPKEGKTKVKKSKAISSEPVVAVTPSLFSNNLTVSTLAGAPKGSDKMPKKSKTASSEPIDVTPLLVLDELTVTADAPNAGQKKKRTKVKSAATADSTKDTLNTTTSSTGNKIPASFNKSKDGEKMMKKVKTSEVGDSTSAIPPSTDAPGGDGQEKRKKVKASVDAEPTHDRTPVTSDAANIPQDSSTKKSRKEKKKMQSSHTDVDVPAPSISGALSKEELKQKRLAEGGERKKDKAVRKSGKSAKDAVLGRKAGQA